MTAFVLVHSPLVGPLTWSAVRDELQSRGIAAVAPALPDSRALAPPYWEQHVAEVQKAMEQVPPSEPLVLVGHSGGGMLLPAIGQASGRPVAAYVFVDAQIPEDGKSRLDFFEKASADRFRAEARDGLLPIWTEETLVDALPDADVRRRFVEELRPLPLAVYEEPLPLFAGWPDAPCAYLQFTPGYRPSADEARQAGWAYRKMEGDHFLMLADPISVTSALVDMVKEITSHAAA